MNILFKVFYKMKKTLGSFYYYNCRRLHTNPQILQVVDNRYHMVTKWILTPNFIHVTLPKILARNITYPTTCLDTGSP